MKQGWHNSQSFFFFFFCFSPVRQRLVQSFLKDILIPLPLSVLLSSPLPPWLINPLSIIWSQSITPFYRLSGGITISLSGAPLRMADPYQTEAMPWTKEPLWSSLHSATNVSISIGCSCCMTVWTGLRFLSPVGRGRVWWMPMIQYRAGGCGWQGLWGCRDTWTLTLIERKLRQGAASQSVVFVLPLILSSPALESEAHVLALGRLQDCI